ncbi:hypothetical protein EBB07_25225 [Paenibacillaceae bacterium]|nr:hypothetical protein EBB07_25225 [Paenibacillaceae bacterium]
METIIASHPYFKVERKLCDSTQQIIVHDHVIQLYSTKISTFHREFLVSNVYDMSFRKMGAEDGILYLHTHQGVYPYTVKDNPVLFINAFKELIST